MKCWWNFFTTCVLAAVIYPRFFLSYCDTLRNVINSTNTQKDWRCEALFSSSDLQARTRCGSLKTIPYYRPRGVCLIIGEPYSRRSSKTRCWAYKEVCNGSQEREGVKKVRSLLLVSSSPSPTTYYIIPYLLMLLYLSIVRCVECPYIPAHDLISAYISYEQHEDLLKYFQTRVDRSYCGCIHIRTKQSTYVMYGRKCGLGGVA